MFRVAFVFATALAFVSQVSALGFNFTGQPTNITAAQLLQVPSGGWISSCTNECNPVNSTVTACSDTDDSCVCNANVAAELQKCEQCMYEFVIQENIAQPGPLVGSNFALTAYTAACQASSAKIALTAALTIPAEGWTGPTDIILNTPQTVVVVGFGAILGGSALLLLANI